MPEQISKYPDVTLQVLKGAGAVCGAGAAQKILTQCPSERFCALPSGEICVYGISDIPQMTQITLQELAAVTGSAPPRGTGLPPVSPLEAGILAAVFLAGLLSGRLWRRRRSGS